MARPLRLEFPGAIYHITARGNAQQPIFLNDQDRKVFLLVLGQTLKAYNAACHAYCLMTNHYHLMIETPDGNLSQVMKQLNGIYTQRFNRRNRRVGHVFQGRFKSIVVDKDSYLLQLCRYIVLNPVRAGMVCNPGEYPWSSYNATAGSVSIPELLSTDWILRQFGDHRESAQAEYRKFVLAGIGEESPWNELKGQCLLGGKNFLEKLVPYLKQKSTLKEVPIIDRHLHRPELKELFPDEVRTRKSQRNEAIRAAHYEYGYKQKQIADFLGLHYTTLSNILRKTLK
jgi:putative transposase